MRAGGAGGLGPSDDGTRFVQRRNMDGSLSVRLSVKACNTFICSAQSNCGALCTHACACAVSCALLHFLSVACARVCADYHCKREASAGAATGAGETEDESLIRYSLLDRAPCK